MFCPYCGNPQTADANFCRACGRLIQSIAPDLRPSAPAAAAVRSGAQTVRGSEVSRVAVASRPKPALISGRAARTGTVIFGALVVFMGGVFVAGNRSLPALHRPI